MQGRKRVIRLRPRGEVVIPVRFRRRLGWSEGTLLSVQQAGASVVLRAMPGGEEARLHPSWSRDQFTLYDRLKEERATAAELAAELGWSAGRIRSALLGLVVRGVVTVDEEGRYLVADEADGWAGAPGGGLGA